MGHERDLTKQEIKEHNRKNKNKINQLIKKYYRFTISKFIISFMSFKFTKKMFSYYINEYR